MKAVLQRPTYQLSPLGALVAALGSYAGHRAWKTLCAHGKQVCDYTEQRGTPAVVLQDGGRVTTK